MDNDFIDELIKEINHVRRNPLSFVPYLEAMTKHFMELEYRNPQFKYYIMTQEGVDSVLELIEFLKRQQPVKTKLN
jgi:hypothetical protein